MCQCGWYIWEQTRLFDSLEELVAFARATYERQWRRWGHNGCVTMIGFTHRPDGRWALEDITDWERNIVDQVEYKSQYYEELHSL